MSKIEIYVNFFTNGAVTWFGAGVIGPFFMTSPKFPLLFYTVSGLLGSYIMLYIAIRLSENEYA